MDFTDWVLAVAYAMIVGVLIASAYAFIGPVPEVPPCTP